MEKAVRSNLWSWALRQGIGIKIEKKKHVLLLAFVKQKWWVKGEKVEGELQKTSEVRKYILEERL